MPIECGACGLKLFGSETPSSLCPNCGAAWRPLSGTDAAPARVGAAAGFAGWSRAFFRDLGDVLARPVQFYRRMPVSGGLSGPLAFALLASWSGEIAAYGWHLAFTPRLSSQFARLFETLTDLMEVQNPGAGRELTSVRDTLIEWVWGMGGVMIAPFQTLLALLFTSAFVWIGARLLITPGRDGAPREISFEACARIVAYACATGVFLALPIFGSMISIIYGWILTILGVREVFHTGTGRAIVVGLFPKLLMLAILGVGLGLFLLVALQLVLMALR